MRKSWLMLALFGWCSWWTAAWAQDSVVPVQPEIVLVDHHAEAKPAPSACAPSCACRPTFCLPRISLSGLFCRLQPSCHPVRSRVRLPVPKYTLLRAAVTSSATFLPRTAALPQASSALMCRLACHVQAPVCHQPCPQPCPPSCPKVHAAPSCGHQVRPLFCREPQPCPRPVVHCHVQAPVCHQPCPQPCPPSCPKVQSPGSATFLPRTVALPQAVVHCHVQAPVCHQPCPQPCPPSCPKVHAAPCRGHQVRPLFCREPQPCPRPVVHCHVQAPVCHQPCPSSCHPSLLERLHNLLRRDCSAPCSAACVPVTPAPAKSEPEKAPLPKPAK
jgi:hypothetical protein